MQYKTQHCSIYFSYVLTFFRFFSFSLWFSFGLRSGRNLVNKKRSLAIAALALVLTLRFCPTICSGGGEGGRPAPVVLPASRPTTTSDSFQCGGHDSTWPKTRTTSTGNSMCLRTRGAEEREREREERTQPLASSADARASGACRPS